LLANRPNSIQVLRQPTATIHQISAEILGQLPSECCLHFLTSSLPVCNTHTHTRTHHKS